MSFGPGSYGPGLSQSDDYESYQSNNVGIQRSTFSSESKLDTEIIGCTLQQLQDLGSLEDNLFPSVISVLEHQGDQSDTLITIAVNSQKQQDCGLSVYAIHRHSGNQFRYTKLSIPIISIGNDLLSSICSGHFTSSTELQLCISTICGEALIIPVNKILESVKSKEKITKLFKQYPISGNITSMTVLKNFRSVHSQDTDHIVAIHSSNTISLISYNFVTKSFSTLRTWDCMELFCAYLPGNIAFTDCPEDNHILVSGPGKCFVGISLNTDTRRALGNDSCPAEGTQGLFPSWVHKLPHSQDQYILSEADGTIWKFPLHGLSAQKFPFAKLPHRCLESIVLKSEHLGTYLVVGSCEGCLSIIPLDWTDDREHPAEIYVFDIGVTVRFFTVTQRPLDKMGEKNQALLIFITFSGKVLVFDLETLLEDKLALHDYTSYTNSAAIPLSSLSNSFTRVHFSNN